MNPKERKALRKKMTWLHAPRRPMLYGWQIPVLFLLLGILWAGLRTPKGRTIGKNSFLSQKSAAAYVTLDPDLARKIFRNARTFWSSLEPANDTNAFEIGFVPLSSPLPEHRGLAKSVHYPVPWEPARVIPVSLPSPLIGLPTQDTAVNFQKLPPPPSGFFLQPSADLKAHHYAFPLPDKSLLQTASGELSFAIETDTDGSVAAVFLLSPRTPAAAVFEDYLQRGAARAACRGEIVIAWNT